MKLDKIISVLPSIIILLIVLSIAGFILLKPGFYIIHEKQEESVQYCNEKYGAGSWKWHDITGTELAHKISGKFYIGQTSICAPANHTGEYTAEALDIELKNPHPMHIPFPVLVLTFFAIVWAISYFRKGADK